MPCSTRRDPDALARAAFFNRPDEIRDRGFEQQRHRASGLNLVTATIVLRNTVYLSRAVEHLSGRGEVIDETLLASLSPPAVRARRACAWQKLRRVDVAVGRIPEAAEQVVGRDQRVAARAPGSVERLEVDPHAARDAREVAVAVHLPRIVGETKPPSRGGGRPHTPGRR